MQPGVTIADIAREAEVSIQTVSRALNNKGEISPATRERILEVAARLGYRPNGIARGLATNRTMTLGLIVPDIANPFFPEIARGAEDVAIVHGYNVFLCNTTEDLDREEAALRILEEKRVDGIILCSARLPDERLFPLLRRQRAVVLVNHPSPPDVAGSVRVDDALGMRQAVAHLLHTHRTPIGFLAGPAHSYSGQARKQEYRAMLAAAGVTSDDMLIRPCVPDVQGGYQAAYDLLADHPHLQSILCYNDLVAIGALQACQELGRRVPDDLAVVGCDDILLAGLVTPPLTTLHVAKREIGAQALALLLDRVAGNREQAEVVFVPDLIVRASAP